MVYGSLLAGTALAAGFVDSRRVVPPRFLGAMIAEALANGGVADDAKYCTVNKVTEDMLKAQASKEARKFVTLFHLYDSRNQLHNIFLQEMKAK